MDAYAPLGGLGADASLEKPLKPPKKPRKPNPSKATGNDQKADQGSSPNAADRAGKPRRTRFIMPRALIGGVPRDDSGNNICFDHNLGKCPNAAGSCPKGLHVCCFPACFDAAHVFSHHKAS